MSDTTDTRQPLPRLSNYQTETVTCCGEELILDYRRCVYWADKATLIVSDIHLGKEEVFQRHGMGIPTGIGNQSIEKLEKLVKHYKPKELMILGDLVHALPASSESWIQSLSAFIKNITPVRFVVITGNHDKPGTADRLSPEIEWHTEKFTDPFRFSHYPVDQEQPVTCTTKPVFTICGHLHPGISLGRKNRNGRRKGQSMTLPVFWMTSQQLVLPAFGEFTGTKTIHPGNSDRTFAVGPDGMMEIPTES